MDTDAIQDGLERAGLSTYQAEAYLTLLERGPSPAVDIAKNCSVPVPRIYDVLKDLEQMDYIETFERDKLHARARDPVDVIERLHQQSSLLSDTAGAIETRWERAPVGEHKMSVMKHADSTIKEAESTIRDAKQTVDLAVTIPQFERVEGALADAHDRGVITRVSLWVEDDEEIDVDTTSVSELRRRVLPGPFLSIVDRTITCFAPTTRVPQPYGVIIDDDILSFIFHWYFQTCAWAICDPVYRDESTDIWYVNLEEFIRDVFQFWKRGATIEISVVGTDMDTGEDVTVHGELLDIYYDTMDVREDEVPPYDKLSGRTTLLVDTEDGIKSIGSWGAFMEDIETHRLYLRNIEFDQPLADADRETDVETETGTATETDAASSVETDADDLGKADEPTSVEDSQ